MATVGRSPQIVGNVGLYYACYRLSMLGWNVMPTARNARGVDIIAYDAAARHFLALQIKTLSKRAAVPLGDTLDDLLGDFWIILNRIAGAQPCSFIMRPSEVRDLAHRNVRDGRASFWLEPKAYEAERFAEKWERLRGEVDVQSAPP